jgi:uroporphyrinogen-III decarboxylase
MTPRERLLTAMRRGVPDRVPCFPYVMRWLRYHRGCVCPRHQRQLAEEFGLDPLVIYGQYTWQSPSNDYVYAPGGNYGYAAGGGYILGTAEAVAPETPAESLRAMAAAAREFGTYGANPTV